MNTYEIGDEVTLTIRFRSRTKVPVDPTTVTLKVRDPDGEETEYVYEASAIERTSTGAYSFALEPTKSGVWSYRWKGSGNVKVAREKAFSVKESEFSSP